ncbi:hypothetical protein PHYPSEUDO_012543 [Phytophthora pseudosyringae]|uniref:[F-actin]-monooxygenase MICAL1-3-like Rossman domain-containing protein n=1 Tax=Phytophthora pseudosyringae TaxID=221518 RepID=A0A8T1V6M9_9STRA|nr:hypothetical protein PHYPSEUDO_012543 [Phytophthora pseudosyringae]
MATLAQSTVPAIPTFSRKCSVPKVERRPPVHTGSRDLSKRVSILDDRDTHVGDGLADAEELHALDRFSDVDAAEEREHRRSLLDSLAIDVGEKYLDEIYREDGSDGPQSARHEPGSQHQNGDKELAWQKVRRHLVEEEEKAAVRKKPRTFSSCSDRGDEDTDTVRLLDILAGSGIQDPCSNSSASSEVSRAPEVNYAPPQTFGSRIDRVGNRLVQFLHRRHPTEDERSAISQSSSSSYEGSRATRWLLASLGRVAKTCQRTELSDGAIARISSHLASIDCILREDSGTSGARRVSSTQRSNDSSDGEFRDPRGILALEQRRPHVASSARSSFKAFAAAQDLCETLAAFNNLLADCGLTGAKMQEPWHVYFHIRNAVYSKLGFRHKQLFRLLDARFNLDVYKQRPVANKRVCVVGAGPVGLRAAVEIALLGGHVSVLEKRTKFSRENRLHLWPWVVQDLASLGAKVLFKNFCKSRTYFHVSTRQLQVILLKVALLVGVKVYSATSFEKIVAPGSEKSDGNPFYSIRTEPQIPVAEYTAVLGATGVNDQLAEPAGINRFVFSQNESLGIVCYFPNLETVEETKVKEFSWTAQLKHHMLDRMREVGIDLENIVYFRGEMHYLVMTPKRNNLLVRGVVRQNYPSSKDLVEDSNVSRNALHAFAKRVVEFAGIPRKTDFTRVNLFDFSSLTRAEKPATVLAANGKKLYVGLIGDSLLEPVWHEGVGTCRGFLGALDGVWMLAQIGVKPDEQLLSDRDLAYRVMQRVSGHHRYELHRNVRKYTVDPRSRYTIDFPQVVSWKEGLNSSV